VSRTLFDGGIKRVEFGYAMARLCNDVPIHPDDLLTVREQRGEADITDGLLPPEDAPVIDAEPMPAQQVTSALTTVPTGSSFMISPEEARNRIKALSDIIRATMVSGVDYNRYPWSPKPFLHKPGAEKLADFYGFVPHYECIEKVEDWKGEFFFYRYRCSLTRRVDGSHVGDKVGSCNSKESKYSGRWEYESKVPGHLDIDRLKFREFKAKKGRDAGQIIRQYWIPNEDICSLVHTIDAMAQKRAYILAVREATRTGGIFDVDEDTRQRDNGGEYE
jgi:hypothetical protein